MGIIKPGVGAVAESVVQAAGAQTVTDVARQQVVLISTETPGNLDPSLEHSASVPLQIYSKDTDLRYSICTILA